MLTCFHRHWYPTTMIKYMYADHTWINTHTTPTHEMVHSNPLRNPVNRYTASDTDPRFQNGGFVEVMILYIDTKKHYHISVYTVHARNSFQLLLRHLVSRRWRRGRWRAGGGGR